MRIIRSLLVIMVALATNAVYIQGQYIYHASDRWGAIRLLFITAYPITIAALVILGVFVWLEFHFDKKADEAEQKRQKRLDTTFNQLIATLENTSRTLEKVAKKLGAADANAE